MFFVTGVLIKQRCDYPNEYVTAISVKTSKDDLQFQEVIGNTDIESMYGAFDGVQTVTLSFPRPYSTPIWRMYVNSYQTRPSMKCDLKGYGYEVN